MNSGENVRAFLADWQPWRDSFSHAQWFKIKAIKDRFDNELEVLFGRTQEPKESPNYLAQPAYLEHLDSVRERHDQALKQFYRDELEKTLGNRSGTSQMKQPETEAQAKANDEPENGVSSAPDSAEWLIAKIFLPDS